MATKAGAVFEFTVQLGRSKGIAKVHRVVLRCLRSTWEWLRVWRIHQLTIQLGHCMYFNRTAKDIHSAFQD